MDYQEALKIIRKENPNKYIYSCYEYDNKYIFTIAIDDKRVEDDLATLDYSVDKDTGKVEIFDYWKESLQNIFGEIETDLSESVRKTLRKVDS